MLADSNERTASAPPSPLSHLSSSSSPLFVFFFFFFFFETRVLCRIGWLRTHYVASDDLELLVFLPLSPAGWDYCHMLPSLVYAMQ
jgi:hypothetical protein